MEHLITLTDDERRAIQAMRDELAEEERAFIEWMNQPLDDPKTFSQLREGRRHP